MLIALTGMSGVGKDEVAEYVSNTYKWEHEFAHCKFSEPMKEAVITMFGVDPEYVTGDKKDEIIPEYNMSGAELTQSLGTHWAQGMIRQDVWNIRMEKIYQSLTEEGKGMIISDVRFECQADWVRSKGGTMVHISRKSVVTKRRNEDPVVNKPGDYKMPNDGTKNRLRDAVDTLVERVYEKKEALRLSEAGEVDNAMAFKQSISDLISGWADEVYPDRTVFNAVAKMVTEEIPEFLTEYNGSSPRGASAKMELADVGILMYDIANLIGVNLDNAIREKMAINKRRSWIIDDETGIMSHESLMEDLAE